MSGNAPSDAQLKYATDLGLIVPSDATAEEVSDMIRGARAEDAPTSSVVRGYAEYYRVPHTRYTGESELLQRITQRLHGDDLGSWFCFWVYCDLARSSKSAQANPYDEIFLEASRHILTLPGVRDSISRYSGDQLVRFGQWTDKDGFQREGGSRRTKAYKAASDYLAGRMGIERWRPPAKTVTPQEAQEPVKQARSGCLSVFLFVGLIGTAAFVWTGDFFTETRNGRGRLDAYQVLPFAKAKGKGLCMQSSTPASAWASHRRSMP